MRAGRAGGNRLFHRARELARGTGGAAAVEFALLAPVLGMVLVGMVDFGLGVFVKMQVQNAAQAGAEYVIANGFNTSNTTPVTTAVTTASTYSGITASPVPSQFYACPVNNVLNTVASGATCSSGKTAGTYVTVSATATYNTIIPYNQLGLSIPSSYTFTAASTVRTQ
ncbi:MAG TPA: TadE/TadG family type IV pilus assembly protein [Stellaceae bacterium]|nr:TadE/TadG family type IV pilus assembly protein [Stellaceae bacterium]